MSSGHGVNFVQLAVGERYESVYSAGFMAVVILLFAFLARTKLNRTEKKIVPDSNLSSRNLAELICVFILNLGDNVMGKENRKYLPFLATLFLYIAAVNMLGLLPGFSMPTDGFSFNLGVALVVFVLYTFWGVREVGIKNYLKHLWGPIWWVGFLLFPIELISHVVRPISLSLRLFGNMTGDHTVLMVFTDLTKFVIPVIFYGLGMFVCLMQAFVFTLLTMIYIRFAVTHEHDEHEEAH